MCFCFFQSLLNFFIGSFLITKQQILPDGSGKKDGFLADVADLISEPAEIEISEIIAVEIYYSLAWIVESHNQLEDGRFSATRLADQSCAIQIKFDWNIVQNVSGGVFWVRKADIL